MRAQKRGDTRGMKVPWAYVRRAIARDWCVPPWVVDGLDRPDNINDEIRIELEIRQCETQVDAETGA